MRRAAITACLVVLTGCATAPRVEHPNLDVAVPDRWTVEVSADSTRPLWWTDFEDAGLEDAVRAALQGNYEIEAAGARMDAAAAQARIAGADLTPDLSLSLDASRRKQNFIGLPIPGGEGRVLSTIVNTFGVSLNTTWEIDLWGRIRSGKSAALADLQAAQAEFEGARLSLVAQTAKAWFSAVEAQQQVRLAEETVGSYERTANEVRERYERGLRSPLDLRLALSNLASAEALLEQRRQQLDGALRQVEILLGRYPSGSLALSDTLAPVPPPAPAGLPAQILSRRPDLVVAERRLAAADRRIAEARASLYPRLSLTGSAGTSSNELKDVLKEDFSVWSLIGNILQPIFQGGRLRAGVDLSKANMRQAWANYGGTLLRAFSEVEAALAAEGFLKRREENLTEAARQAEAAQGLADEQYREGLIDLTTLLETQRRALTAQSQLLSVRRERLGVRIDLHLALGGGFGSRDEASSLWKESAQDQEEDPS